MFGLWAFSLHGNRPFTEQPPKPVLNWLVAGGNKQEDDAAERASSVASASTITELGLVGDDDSGSFNDSSAIELAIDALYEKRCSRGGSHCCFV
jgi:hypothetical protein